MKKILLMIGMISTISHALIPDLTKEKLENIFYDNKVIVYHSKDPYTAGFFITKGNDEAVEKFKGETGANTKEKILKNKDIKLNPYVPRVVQFYGAERSFMQGSKPVY